MAWSLTKHTSLTFLIVILFKGSSGQHNGLLNQSNLNNPLGPPLPNRPNNQNLNQISKCPLHQSSLLNTLQTGRLQTPVNLQQKLLQQAAAQKEFMLRQRNTNLATNFPQEPNTHQQLHHPANIQQRIQDLNLQQLQQQLSQGNLQQLTLQERGSFQQQNLPPTLASLQLPNTQRSDISFESPQLANLPLSALNPNMVPQISDPGIMSPLSHSLSHQFNNIQPNIENLPVANAQNPQMPFASMPSSVMDISQANNNVMTPLSQIPDLNNVNNQQQSFALVAVPLQNSQPNTPTNTAQISNIPSQVKIVKSLQPQMFIDPSTAPVEFDQGQLSLLSSRVTEPQSSQISSFTSSNANPIITAISTQGSKSSNLKTILPLIFNLLKERNTGCSCNKCGCMNNNKQEPQIFSEYANQNNYGCCAGKSQNNEDVFHDDIKSSTPPSEEKYEEHNKVNTDNDEDESVEYTDSYEDEE